MNASNRGPDRGPFSLIRGLASKAGLFALSSVNLSSPLSWGFSRPRPVALARSLSLALSLALSLSLTSCKEEASWKQNKFKKHELLQSTSDPQMPEILWERIESVYTGAEVHEPEVKKESEGAEGEEAGAESHGEAEKSAHGAEGESEKKNEGGHEAAKEGEKKAEGGGHEGGGGGEGGEGGGGKTAELEKGVLPTEFAPLKVYLVEKNRGVLHGINHEIVFGPGGGEIDLQDFVENRKGSFYFAVEFLPEVPIEKGSPSRKIFFLSNGVRRHNKSETIGNGCRNYYDITSSFDAAMKTDGYALNTTDLRHVSALAGTFFFVMKNEGKLWIAQLTIKDSSHRALQCRR